MKTPCGGPCLRPVTSAPLCFCSRPACGSPCIHGKPILLTRPTSPHVAPAIPHLPTSHLPPIHPPPIHPPWVLPGTSQVHSHLRAFACVVPAAQYSFSSSFLHGLALVSFRSWCTITSLTPPCPLAFAIFFLFHVFPLSILSDSFDVVLTNGPWGLDRVVCFAHVCIPCSGMALGLLWSDVENRNSGELVKITVRCSWFEQNGDLAFPLEGGHPELVEQCHELFGDSATAIVIT